jgi:hypothetical protein
MTAKGGFYLHCPSVECGAPWETEPETEPAGAEDKFADTVSCRPGLVPQAILRRTEAATGDNVELPSGVLVETAASANPTIKYVVDPDDPVAALLWERLQKLDTEREKLIRALDVLTKDL